MVHNAFVGERFELLESEPGLSLAELRAQTLGLVEQISKALDFPFCNAINSPLLDAVYHDRPGRVMSLDQC